MVQRPLEEVFAFVANLENWAEWQPAFRKSEPSRSPMQVGTRFRQALDVQGQRIEFLCEVTEYEPNEKLSFAYVSEGTSFTFDFVFEPIEDGSTRLTGKGEGHMSGFLGLFEPLVGHEVNKQVKANLEGLKVLLESRTPDA